MLIIDDSNQINWLIKAICLLKFETCQDDPDVMEISGSPIIADLSNKAYDALIASLKSEGKDGIASRIQERRDVEVNQLVLASVKQHIINIKKFWISWDQKEKKTYIDILFSPYEASPEFGNQYITNIDALFSS